MSKETREFLKRKDVTVAYEGIRKRKGVYTNEPCIVVGVKKKKSEAELQPHEILPKEVDVVEAEFQALMTHRQKHRPIIGGISGIEKNGTACTIGAVIIDNKTNKLTLLTNNHCAGMLYNTDYTTPTVGQSCTTGLEFIQPSPYDGGSIYDDVIGRVLRAEPLNFGDSAPINLIDAAVVSIDNINNSWFSIIELDDGPFEFLYADDYQVNDEVTKSGRTTGVTTGNIFHKDMAVNVQMGSSSIDVASFDNQIGFSGTRVSEGGDSGSALLIKKNNKYFIIGLLFAGGTIDGESVGICNHISHIENLLDIRAWDGSLVMPHNTPREITINGITFEEIDTTDSDITHYHQGLKRKTADKQPKSSPNLSHHINPRGVTFK